MTELPSDETETPIDREALKEHARANAFDTGHKCEHCNGDGKVYPGRRVIHTRSAHGFGADWDEAAVLDLIDEALAVQWRRGMFGPYLAVTRPDGSFLAIDIPPMTESGGAR